MFKNSKLTRRVFSFLLSIVLLVTVFSISNIGTIKTSAFVSNEITPCPITFYVPETIYLEASIYSADKFEYYIDCNSNGFLGTAKRNDSKGTVYFYCEQATSCSITCNDAAAILGQTTGTNSIDTECTGGVLLTGVNAGSSKTISWTVTYTVNGHERIAKAYSACYAPFYEPIASAIKFHNDDGIGTGNRAYLQSATWLSGIHSYSPSKPWKCNLTSGNRLAPLLGVVTPPGGAEVSSWLTNSEGGSNYTFKEDGSNDYLVVLNSATGTLTVDSSRYTNYNQIPNLSYGMIVSDATSNDDWVKGYVSDYTGQTVSLNDATSEDEGTMLSCYNTKGTILAGEFNLSKSAVVGIRFNNTFGSRAITKNRTGSEKYILKGCVYGANDGEDIVNCMLCPVNVTFVDKSTLRNKVRYYTNLGLQQSDYTTTSWNNFVNKISDAANRLGNPASTNTSYSDLDTAYSTLSKQTYTATITHLLPCQTGITGMVNGISTADVADGSNNGYIEIIESLTFDSGDTVLFSPNNYIGYTISSASGSTTSIDAQQWNSRNSKINVTYLYSANQYAVTLNYGVDPIGGYAHKIYTSTYDISTISVSFNYSYALGNLPSSPKMTGWSFGGWFYSPEFTQRIYGSTIMTDNQAHTAYAKWAPYFSGGHGLKTGNTINGTVLDYDDMFLISNLSDLDKIDQYNSTYNYTTSSGFSYNQTSNITTN